MAVDGMMMAMQARKRSEEDILLARVLHRRGQAHARGRVKMVQSIARRTLGSKRSEGGACGGPPAPRGAHMPGKGRGRGGVGEGWGGGAGMARAR